MAAARAAAHQRDGHHSPASLPLVCARPKLDGAPHKLWLSQKPGRNLQKKPKDARQGNVLLDATRYFLQATHPMDNDFVLALPDELRTVFNDWAATRSFDPAGAANG